jgi:predicted restriction endonuclease
MSNLSDQEVKNLLQTLRQNLQAFPEGMQSLEYELESAAKHIPAYIKIVKSHIEQLRNVLELENHNHRTLETAGLAAPVQQLIKLFGTLQDDDIQMLEDLAHVARSWHPEMSHQALTEADSAQNFYESAETAS